MWVASGLVKAVTRKKVASGYLVNQRASAEAHRNAMTMCRWNSDSQNSLHCHSVATVTPIVEETTGAIPLPIVIVRGVNIVFAPKRRLKACKLNAFGFFGVPFRFRDLVNHA